MGKWLGIFIILFLLNTNSLRAQEIIKYDVSIAGISIGEMIAKREKKGEELHYELKSDVSFWFFGKINLDYLTKVIYHGKRLNKANVLSKTNKGNFESNIQWQGDHYRIKSTNYKHELDTVIQRPFYLSAAVFYFEEPTQAKEFLAEAYGLPAPIKKVKDYYEVIVNGNTNRFYYVNGKLDKAVMEFPIKNYVVKRKE
ncbi:DUF6134 family protein [Cecembia rubra]|uniref:DUF3108 domain-containing protein n=1 Tax=Cecembia rubra TaxID=1485585 RepID=A0A2P8EE09_9BACT|nr:DUF6134 family protein [Cecembia rubra]PSL07677.1 hypothetical protein CLV48_101614 [Cecembia rubra]